MKTLLTSFLGNSPWWFKITILSFLVLNPIILVVMGPTVAGWCVMLEFIFTLAMALQCYPLQSGGLIAITAIALGLTTPESVYNEVHHNLSVILLLVFMVAAIHFMKPLLMFIFGKAFVKINSKIALSVTFLVISAILSAFLDALTVTAVLIAVFTGFYGVYESILTNSQSDLNEDGIPDSQELKGESLTQFRAFLRSLIMHGVVGTALGGVATIVGEPQNLVIGHAVQWEFIEFANRMLIVSGPVFITGVFLVIILEKFKLFGYGQLLPHDVREILEKYVTNQDEERTRREKVELGVQAIMAVFLIVGLALHIAEVGLIGLGVLIIVTAFRGIISEHKIGHAFEEALPFTSLLVVFFAIVAVIHDQHLFSPIIDYVLALPKSEQPGVFYLANGLLSAISDNVFVATVYIGEVSQAYTDGLISKEHFERLAIAINAGTNIPSVATPNGQAAFLFLLTSALAPAIKLSYLKMVKMAFPYFIGLGLVGYFCVAYLT